MNYFEFPIDLKFNKDEFLSDPAIAPWVKNIEKFDLPLFDHRKVIPNFFKSLETMFDSTIIKSRIFRYPPEFSARASHIDGHAGELVKWSLNIPLFGTEGSTMNWFELTDEKQDKQKQGKRSAALIYDITTPPIDSLELLTPHIVKTDIPHSVINEKLSTRAILSVRFNNCLDDSIETIYKKFIC